jgi:hypothetical protein
MRIPWGAPWLYDAAWASDKEENLSRAAPFDLPLRSFFMNAMSEVTHARLEQPMMTTRRARVSIVALTLLGACAQSPAPPAESSTPKAAPSQRPSVTACALLTKPEVQAAAGWPVVEATPTDNPGPPALSICNFMGKDLTRVITVWYGEGSGGRYKSSADMATALGTRNGMLTRPAQPLDGLGVPATREDQLGGLVHVHGINGTGDELTVAAPSFDIARTLFVNALARFPSR